MLGTVLSIFKLHISIIPARPCTITLEMLNSIKSVPPPILVQNKEEGCARVSELHSHAPGLWDMNFTELVCVHAHIAACHL